MDDLPPNSTAFQRGVSGAPTTLRKILIACRKEKYKLFWQITATEN